MASNEELKSEVDRLKGEVKFLKEAVDELTLNQLSIVRSIKQFYPNFGIG